ncbi:SPOR domain-containing protein [Denitrificimonas sp. JX-1]|uniref:SPOR domain-containing protein n=1 Tax=Denitrificimonas halotolerans TaxID=3098930 RepID=A0ABU5GPG5_9GAMM|nr:SPOR domain-containing protein [Denitrificimonas sp. JX-1]MDY7218846.1 SPOR domain-containing protein [Denitrificimonas sp. JX-1]
MAAAESKLKQRIVGALVLIALAVIFVPMLFKKEEAIQQVIVQAPPMPEAPAAPEFPVDEVEVPTPIVDETYELVEEAGVVHESAPVVSIPSNSGSVMVQTQPEPVVSPQPVTPKAERKPVITKPAQQAVTPGIDKNNLPVSWSVQIANVGNKANAEALRDKFRKKQYNAYVRSSGGTHRVLIGPLVKDAEARALCKSLKTREKQDCFVVRYEP